MPDHSPIPITTRLFKANPFAIYAQLRNERPLARITLPNGRLAWLLTRYDDVAALLKDMRFIKDPANLPQDYNGPRGPWIPSYFKPMTRGMLDRDDPDHSRLRRLITSSFTPRRIAELRPRTEAISEQLLDAITGSKFDLLSDYALPLPVTVISEMIGVPFADRLQFARWSHALIRNRMTPLSVLLLLPNMVAFIRYLRSLIALKTHHPEDDVTSDLVRACEGDRALDADELVAMLALLLTAGHETTTNLIGNGVVALLGDRSVYRSWPQQSEKSATAVEEMLRFAGPLETSTFRYAREPVILHGITIATGDVILGAINSANRDSDQFGLPDHINLARTPNRHLTFGDGRHFCVGSALARMEGDVAMRGLVYRFPNLNLDIPLEQLKWRDGLILRGLTKIPVILS
jgi:cytochrome P450